AGSTRIAVNQAPAEARNRSVVLGVRPEHLVLDPAGTAAEVVVVEPTGSETHVVASLAGKEITCVLNERVALDAGPKISLSFRQAALHFFDPLTTQRIG